MRRVGRWVAALGIALSLSGCTLLGVGVGAAVATSMNGDPRVQTGDKPRTSVAKSTLLGAAIGLVLDIGFVALSVSESGRAL